MWLTVYLVLKMQSNLNKYSEGTILLNIKKNIKFKVVSVYGPSNKLLYGMCRLKDNLDFKILCSELDKKTYIIVSLKDTLKRL